MLVFLSWSGERSHAVAEALKLWLGQTIQAVQPWLSADIEKGSRWGSEIAAKLELSTVGIVCLTRDNLDSRWLLFEAGALSKERGTYACTFLLDVNPQDVEPPLSQFQHTLYSKHDVRRLVETINAAAARAGERALDSATLNGVFETFWPQLDEQLRNIASVTIATEKTPRSQSELLNEILNITRAMERRQTASDSRPSETEAGHPLCHSESCARSRKRV